MSYFYIIDNKDWNYESKKKYGFTKNPIMRILNSHEQHSYQSHYIKLYYIEETKNYKINYKEYDKIISIISRNNEIITNIEDYYDIKFTYLRNINKYLVNNDGSTEFIYETGLDILHNLIINEFPLLGLNVSIVNIEDINIEITKEIKHKKYELLFNPFNHKKINNTREYQQIIISKCVDILNNKNKVYLELATGGGKSYIIYMVINIIKPKIIIIFSPLDIIKNQNISKKYISILDNKYKIFSKCPNKNIDDNIIITSCTQSYKNIYDYIIKYNIKDICIWFDESHWGFEEWSNCVDDNIKKFFLEDTNNISKRIFTSASPDKELVLKNKKIFGELYNPIKVCDLIKDKWLCSINPYVFSINKNDPDIITYNLDGFKDKNKMFGFSFHSNCDNAFNLFMKHYHIYKMNKTDIKPFLLLGDNFKEDYDIILDYDYKDVKIFETTPNSIGYVVKRFSIGYDFDKIDILFISDPKTAYKDIIQTIGRGMRSDKLGENGTNLYKKLDLYLPVYIEEEYNNEYKNIIEVLRYLICDIGLEYKNINFNNNIQNGNDGNKKIEGDKYIGNEEVKGILLDLLKNYNKKLWNCKKITEHLCKNNIHNQKDYNDYYKNNPELAIPENIFMEYPEFIWYDTYKKDECPYYSKIECIEIIKKLDNDDLYIYDDDEKLKYFNNLDNKIPIECLWGFYGGNRYNYFN